MKDTSALSDISKKKTAAVGLLYRVSVQTDAVQTNPFWEQNDASHFGLLYLCVGGIFYAVVGDPLCHLLNISCTKSWQID